MLRISVACFSTVKIGYLKPLAMSTLFGWKQRFEEKHFTLRHKGRHLVIKVFLTGRSLAVLMAGLCKHGASSTIFFLAIRRPNE